MNGCFADFFDAEYRLLDSELFIDRKRVVVWT